MIFMDFDIFCPVCMFINVMLCSLLQCHVWLQAEMIHQLGEQIGTKLAKAEAAGAEGLVEESLKSMEEVEDLKKKKSQLEVSCQSCL